MAVLAQKYLTHSFVASPFWKSAGETKHQTLRHQLGPFGTARCSDSSENM